jgi:hypothetical protein
MGERILAQIRIRISARQLTSSIVEVHPAAAPGGKVQRLAKRREVRDAAGFCVQSRGSACRSKVGYDRGVPVEQAFTLVVKMPAKWRGGTPAWLRAGL